ncbi:hypothetical protein A3K86_03225 [Photobacterium jeanii]|uniref:OmpR/PhoB-type domain-containing protein n=1 Tax=Photobacterium jeanii TaxID=858640 RepID=A0A178KMN6_9GAMM|nr:response regulator transcription factor [Photobacterium jeanii]OAN17943.1 hypothetical protein A3K86_03225 [Photobacterium jeanii]PST92387.1 DNA-binding response regulator [Photobacterium jeanii]
MTTKALTRCYRFPDVDFEPDLRTLVWKDGSESLLTVHESRLLEALCYYAGEVVCTTALYNKTFIQIDSGDSQHNSHFDLHGLVFSLNEKLIYQNHAAIEIESLSGYGYRVPLPNKTCRLIHNFKQPKATPLKQLKAQPLSNNVGPEPKDSLSILGKVVIVIIAGAGAALYLLTDIMML